MSPGFKQQACASTRARVCVCAFGADFGASEFLCLLRALAAIWKGLSTTKCVSVCAHPLRCTHDTAARCLRPCPYIRKCYDAQFNCLVDDFPPQLFIFSGNGIFLLLLLSVVAAPFHLPLFECLLSFCLKYECLHSPGKVVHALLCLSSHFYSNRKKNSSSSSATSPPKTPYVM